MSCFHPVTSGPSIRVRVKATFFMGKL
jgi:hypothetical protein